MQAHQKLLTTAEEISALAARLKSQKIIALDTEFIRETTFYPIIALIQVATDQESWLVDPIALNAADMKPLLEVFTDPGIVKVLHAAQADQECLYTEYGVVATPSFDTAAGASLCGYGDSIGLAKLLKEVLGVSLPKGHARTDWTARPLQDQLLAYAHQDVAHLVRLAEKLFAQLDSKGRRKWAFELSARFENKKNYEPNAEGIATKLAKSGRVDRRGFATLIELVRWRENRVRELDVPRRRVADDDILVALASVRPRDMQHLSAFRGLNRGEFKHSGDAILAAVKKAMAIPDAQLADVPRVEVPDGREARVLELVQCFVKLLAEDLQISARHLVTSDDLLPMLRRKFETIDEVVAAGILSAGAAAMIGEDLLEMMRGRRALSVGEGGIRVQKV
jgi:ribonuclease D